MNPLRLASYFDRISDAPDAVSRLRRFILDLAVRGKLIEQDPTDESASDLLRRIQTEKARLVKEGKINLEKPPKPTSPDDLAFELRPKWEAVRISQILVELQTGPFGSSLHQSDYQKGGIPVINPASIKHERIVPIDRMAVGPATLKRLATFKLRAGDIVMARRGEMGRCAVVTSREEGWLCGTGSLILRLPSCVCARFFVVLIGSPFVREYLGGSAVGATMQNLNQSILLNLIIGLPPLAEQQRIVAKVDELMALCDRLEKSVHEREHQRDRLTTASLYRLNNGTNVVDFRSFARFHLNHLPRLITRIDHISEFRKTILNLAVRGKIAAQNPQDEPVAEQLLLNDRVREATAKQDHRADAERQVLLASEDRWNVPPSWEWCALADLVLFIDYRGKTPNKIEKGVRLVTAKNIKKGFINAFPEEFLSEREYHAWMTRGFPKQDDILFTTEAPMGNAAVVRLPERFALAQRVICFRPYGAVNPDFLALQLLAQPFQSILDKTATGLTAKGIKAAKLKRLPMALPPLAEQLRIVCTVNEMMQLCEQLESQLTKTEDERCGLLEAVLHHALIDASEAPTAATHAGITNVDRVMSAI
ncbi:MAG TPA: restriction endonuclease subunit S [Edaphobacter sp.]|nr:restriction endonuclease subunit S [Edaphobacter sp.]